MPQPPLDITKYLSNPLPSLREAYPPGTGGTGPRDSFTGDLESVQVIDDFAQHVTDFLKTLPQEPIPTHPAHKYPKYVQTIKEIPSVIKSPADLQTALSHLPLKAVSSVLTALDAHPDDLAPPSQAVDAAGYESDGGEDPGDSTGAPRREQKTKAWSWKFNKSPLGSGEFYLQQQGSNDVKLVVRTINSAAFSTHDWDEYVVTGPYHYNTKSKASWYWSRSWTATRRLNTRYYVFTDWKRWAFGVFDQSGKHAWISPIIHDSDENPTASQALLYWAKSAAGAEAGFKEPSKKQVTDVKLFPDNPPRRVGGSGEKKGLTNKVKAANESDIEESDVEAS